MALSHERNYGVIYLGASRFPFKENLDKASFATSKEEVAKVLTSEYLLADSVESLDLFDRDCTPLEVVEQISSFLTGHPEINELIIYYCGHGAFLPGPMFYLTLRSTREGREAMTGLTLKPFRLVLDDLLLNKRIYLVLDCCYAASAAEAWQGDRVKTVVVNEVEDAFPPRGTALLAAASRTNPAIAPSDRETTLFTGHFVEAIRTGVKDERRELSFADLAENIYKRIRSEHLATRVLPELHVPRQSEGDVSRIPFIRNRGALAPAQRPAAGLDQLFQNLQYNFKANVGFTLFEPRIPAAEAPSQPAPDQVARNVAPEEQEPVVEQPPKVTQPKPRQAKARPREAKKPLASDEAKLAPLKQEPLVREPLEHEHASQKPLTQALKWTRTAAALSAWLATLLVTARDFRLRASTAFHHNRVPLFVAGSGLAVVLAIGGYALVPPPPPLPPAIVATPIQPPPVAPASRFDTTSVPSVSAPPPAAKPAAPNPVMPRKQVVAAEQAYCGSPASAAIKVAAAGGPLVPANIRITPVVTGAKEVRAVVFAPDRTVLATAGDDGRVRLWDPASFKLTRTLRPFHTDKVYGLDIASQNSDLLVASAGHDGVVRIWNARTGSLTDSFDARSNASPVQLWAVALYPRSNPRFVYAAGMDGLVRIWDLQHKLPERHVTNRTSGPVQGIRTIALAPNGRGDFVTGNWGGTLTFSADTVREPTKSFSKLTLRAAYSPDGKWLLAGGSDAQLNNLKLWNPETRALVRSYEGHTGYVVSVAWSPDGKRVAAGGGGPLSKRDAILRVWNRDGKSPLAVLAGHTGDIEAVAFADNDGPLVSVSEDKTLRVWDVAGARELMSLMAFDDDTYLAYTPDGCYSGPPGVEKHFRLSVNGEDKLPDASLRKTLFNPNGFSFLAAR